MFKYSVTVFTPTYNRAYIIENLYNSLKRQTNLDFEWLVVDDGSTDDAERIYAKLIADECLLTTLTSNLMGQHFPVNLCALLHYWNRS